MTPSIQAIFAEVYANDPLDGARFATADAMIQELMQDRAADAAALANAFAEFSPNLLSLLDSVEGVAVLATAIAALTGSSITYQPTSH